VRDSQGPDGVCGWWTFSGGVAPGCVTRALSGRVPHHIQDLPRPVQHLLLSDETDAKLKPILNPQQYAKWEQIRAEERQQMMQKMRQK